MGRRYSVWATGLYHVQPRGGRGRIAQALAGVPRVMKLKMRGGRIVLPRLAGVDGGAGRV